jgi:hypothetical protein
MVLSALSSMHAIIGGQAGVPGTRTPGLTVRLFRAAQAPVWIPGGAPSASGDPWACSVAGCREGSCGGP